MRNLVAALGVLALAGCATLPRAIEPKRPHPPAPATAHFHVLSHGWHTGIAVPARDLNRRMPALAQRFPAAEYYEIGWGDAGFYQSPVVTTGLALQAMFNSPGTVMHIVGFDENPASYFPSSVVRQLAVSPDHYQNLLAFLASSFATDSDGTLISQGHGLYGDSQFYQAVGTYFVCNTCNKWTAKALYSAGLDLDPTLRLTSSSVLSALPEVRHDAAKGAHWRPAQ
jgi:uncharacterized protein (TIGR02117 family)